MDINTKHVTKAYMSQLSEKIPGAFSVAARSLGLTHQSLKESLETGTIQMVEFLANFKEQLTYEYEGQFRDEFKLISAHEIADCIENPSEFIDRL